MTPCVRSRRAAPCPGCCGAGRRRSRCTGRAQPAEQPQPVGRRQRHISSRQKRCPGSATTGTSGQRNGRSASGLVSPHDQHRRADDDEGEQGADVGQVQQGVDRQQRGQGGDEEADEDRADFHGVRNLGWTSAKNAWGTRPSRAIARKTRGCAEHHDQQHRGDAGDAASGDDELGPAQARAASNASDTPASLLDSGRAPCRSARRRRRCRAPCRSTSEAMMPIGTSRWGFFASSAWVETESKPM